MQVTVKQLFFASVAAASCLATLPGVVLAYDYGDARRDESVINRLTAQGAINPAQAQVLDRDAMMHARSSWWHHNVPPIVTGIPTTTPVVAPMMAPLPIVTAPQIVASPIMPAPFTQVVGAMPISQPMLAMPRISRGQEHREDYEIDKLRRDHAISHFQAGQMKAAVNAEARGWTSPAPMYPPSMPGSVAPVLMGTPTVYPANYYQSTPGVWQQARNYFHY